MTDPDHDPHRRYSRCLGQIVRARREAKGWSQVKFAALSGLSRAGVSKIENGLTSPSAESQWLIARALSMWPADLALDAERLMNCAA